MLQEPAADAAAPPQPRHKPDPQVVFMLSQKIQDLDDALDVRSSVSNHFWLHIMSFEVVVLLVSSHELCGSPVPL